MAAIFLDGPFPVSFSIQQKLRHFLCVIDQKRLATKLWSLLPKALNQFNQDLPILQMTITEIVEHEYIRQQKARSFHVYEFFSALQELPKLF